MIQTTAKILFLTFLATPFAAPNVFAAASSTNAAAKPADKLVELFGDPVVAKGKDVEVKRSDLDAMIISLKAIAAGRGQQVPTDFEKLALQNLINTKILLGKATDADLAKGKELFREGIQKLKTNSKLSDDEFNDRLDRELKVQGQTKEQWEKQAIEQTTIQSILERELKVTVTDEMVKNFYDENPARFEKPEMVRASHILLSTRDPSTQKPLSEDKKVVKRKQAEDLLKRARAGEDFAKLAQEFSEDPGSKEKGGEYTFPRGAMVPEFESAAFSLNTNQISDIVTTQFGYHIIKLSEKIPATKLELAKVAEDLKEGLRRRDMEKLIPDYMDKIKKEANVEILDEKLKLKETTRPAAAEPAKADKAEGKKTDDKK